MNNDLNPTTYIFTTSDVFAKEGKKLKYSWGDSPNPLTFSGYFTTHDNKSLSWEKPPSQYLVAPWKEDGVDNHMPIYEYGTILYPVWNKA